MVRRSLTVALLLALLVPLAPASLPRHASAAAATPPPIEMSDADIGWEVDLLPVIGGRWVAWNEATGIKGYDLLTRQQVLLTTERNTARRPAISNRWLAWLEGEWERGEPSSIKVKDLVEGTVATIPNDVYAEVPLRMTRDWLVYVRITEPWDVSLRARNLLTHEVVEIAPEIEAWGWEGYRCADAYYPWVVWTAEVDGLNGIRAYNLETDEEVFVDDVRTLTGMAPFAGLADDRVAYPVPRDGATVNDVAFFDLTSRTKSVVELGYTPADDDWAFAAGGDWVIWEVSIPVPGRDGWSQGDIWGHRIGTTGANPIRVHPSGLGRIDAQGPWAVWSDGEWSWGKVVGTRLEPADPMPRVAGADRYATSIAASQQAFAEGACPDVVVASGRVYPDALSAASLAGVLGSPILLVPPDALTAPIEAELARLTRGIPDPRTVWIVGGPSAVSPAVASRLQDLGYAVQRRSGDTRYSTARAVAREVVSHATEVWGGRVFVATGGGFADALAVSPIAYRTGMPIILVADQLDSATESLLVEIGVTEASIVGGTAVVPTSVEADLGDLLGSAYVGRLAGSDRYATAATVFNAAVQHGWADGTSIGLASGLGFPDALSGGATLGRQGGSLLLSRSDRLPSPSAEVLWSRRSERIEVTLIGGERVLSSTVDECVWDALNLRD